MLTTKDFLEYYSTISNSDLLLILYNKRNYQASAIDAANQELLRRQLSEEEINDANTVIEENKIRKEKEKEKITIIENKVRSTGKNIFETLKPIQTDTPSIEKKINAIGIIFGAISIYRIFTYRWYFLSLEFLSDYFFEAFIIIYPLVVLPLAALIFLMRKKLGWILLASYLTYSALWVLKIFTSTYIWNSSRNSGISNFFPAPSSTSLIFQLIILIGTLYVVSKPAIREVFFITKSLATVVIGLSWLITFIIIFFNS